VHHARDDLPGLAGRVGGFFAFFGQTFQAFVEFRIPMYELDHLTHLHRFQQNGDGSNEIPSSLLLSVAAGAAVAVGPGQAMPQE
jgi:hypothetical protein